MTNLVALPIGTELASDFRITRVLGAGGFGITYLADEMALGRQVTIKEYFPGDFATRAEGFHAAPRTLDCADDYQWGLDRFIEEAQTLAKFNHPNIVRVYRYFAANSTAYMVLHYEDGQSFKNWLKTLARAPRQNELDVIVAPLLDALELIHKADFLHRDIAPDNIIIRQDNVPVLIDFGAARGAIAAHSKTISALVKPGYSPYEQYAETTRQQGPWTDIYALGATLYHAITGKRPPDAPSRVVHDEIVRAREAALSSYRPSFLAAIDRALAINVEARPQSVAEWRGGLLAPEPTKPGWIARTFDKRRETLADPLAEDLPPTRTRPLPVPPAPPPPDAPGPKGRLLDYLDRVKAKSEETAPRPLSPQISPKAHAPVATADPKTEILPRPSPRVPLPAKIKPARPRPIGDDSKSGWFGSLLFKLVIVVGVAGAAFMLQNQWSEIEWPRIERRGSAIPASEIEPAVRVETLRGHSGPVTAVIYTANGDQLVTTGADTTVKVWRSSGGLVRSIPLDDGPAVSLALFGDRLLTGHGEGQLVLWNYAQGTKIGTFRRNEASIWALAFAGEPERFVAAGHDWKIALWDARVKEGPVHVFEGHENAVQALAYFPKGNLLASGGADRSVKLWNLETLELVRSYRGARDFITVLAFSPDGRTLAAGSLDGQIRVLSTTSGRTFQILRGHKGRVGALAFSPDGTFLASGGDDGALRLWDTRRGRILQTLAGHSGAVRGVAFAPEGDRIASVGDDSTVRLWTPSRLRRPTGRETN